MSRDVVDGKQETMFGISIPKVGACPTTEELERITLRKAGVVIARWHHGAPPKGMSFTDLQQEVRYGTLYRLRKFRHGGVKTLDEFAYIAACFSLRDIQRKDQRRWRPQREYPLLEIMERETE